MDSEDVRVVRVVPDPECVWCGEPVSQLGTRTPRRYCQRSHRQRALEARRLGLPMKKDRPPKEATPTPAALVRAEDDRQAALFLADAVVRTSVDVPPPAPAALPDPPAAVPVVVPVVRPIPDRLPKPARRRSGMTASAIPLSPYVDGVREELDPRGWLRAFDAYEERLQEQPDDGSNGPTHGA